MILKLNFLILFFITMGFYGFSQDQTFATQNKNVIPSENLDFGSVRLSFGLGGSRRLASTPDGAPADLKKIIDGIRNGLDLIGSISYVGKKNMGIGLLIDSWSSSTTGNISVKGADNIFRTTKNKIDDKMLFVGPGFFMRFIKKDISFNMLLALGYHGYSSNIISTYQTFSVVGELEGSTAGLGLDGSLDYKLSKSVHLGLGVNILTGSLSEYKQTTAGKTETKKLSENERENLFRIGINGGLRITI
jgi:hypothetical protein